MFAAFHNQSPLITMPWGYFRNFTVSQKQTKQTKQLSMVVTARVIWLCACVRCLPHHRLRSCTEINNIPYHNTLCISIVFTFFWGHFNSQDKLKTMLMQSFGVTNKEYYGMLWYFLQWSIGIRQRVKAIPGRNLLLPNLAYQLPKP